MKHTDIINASKNLSDAIERENQENWFNNGTICVKQLGSNQFVKAYFVGEMQPKIENQQTILSDMQTMIVQTFSISEVDDLCRKLNIEPELVKTANMALNDYVRELIGYMNRRGRISHLLLQCQQERPHLLWPRLDKTDPILIHKPDLAVIISLAPRPGLIGHDVATYFDKRGDIDAHFFILQSNQNALLDPKVPWDASVQLYHRTLTKIRHIAQSTRVHIFLSAPSPFIFAAGAVWGTVDNAVLYHRQDDYYAVVNINRTLHS